MKKTFLAAAVVAVGLAAAVPVHRLRRRIRRQHRASQCRPRWPADQADPVGPADAWAAPMGGFREVMRDLTDAQREQVKAIHERHAERIRPLAERAHAAREAHRERA